MIVDPPYIQRIHGELRWLKERANIDTVLLREEMGDFVLFKEIETSGKNLGLPEKTDVLVPVPTNYPTTQIDMPALLKENVLISHVVGGSNPQSNFLINTETWVLLSYHPYANGGGPNWNPMQHGFHDYYTQLYTWLHRLI